MEFIRGIHNLQPHHHGCVISVGNFDGFHRGHQALITELQLEGLRRSLPVVVMIFEPQPQEYFRGADAPTRLTRLRDKIKYLAAAKVDTILCVSFNKHFSTLSARAFMSDLLIKKLGIRLICVGDDFRFGAHREGDCSMLRQAGTTAGFEVVNTLTYTNDERRISSTAVREALAQDRLIDAEILLGHPYRISGRVIHGKKLGRTIGFPTANLSLKGLPTPLKGVYAVQVYGISDHPFPGAANIGTRPTVSGSDQRLEIHLLDVSLHLYNYHIEVVIRTKVRNEQRFSSLKELKWQIENDVMNIRKYFQLTTSP